MTIITEVGDYSTTEGVLVSIVARCGDWWMGVKQGNTVPAIWNKDGTLSGHPNDHIVGPWEVTKNKRYRHRVTGSIYEVMAMGYLNTSKPAHDMTQLVIYQGPSKMIWARPKQEFMERFVLIQEGEQS